MCSSNLIRLLLPGGGGQGPLPAENLRHIRVADIIGIRDGGQLLNHPLELRKVAGPAEPAQLLHGMGVKPGNLLAQLQIQVAKVQARQGRDLVQPAAKGGQGQPFWR